MDTVISKLSSMPMMKRKKLQNRFSGTAAEFSHTNKFRNLGFLGTTAYSSYNSKFRNLGISCSNFENS